MNQSGTELSALSAVDLHKQVRVGFRGRKVEILRGVDMSVARGEVYGLLGPNGAGKTTTVKVALGLMRPSSGSVSTGDTGRDQIGYLPENPYFYDYLSGREFLHLAGRLFGLDRGSRRERVERLLADVGLTEAAETQLRKYSKGMLQRIGIAQALVNAPRLVLLDEPMTGLDPVGRVEVKRIIDGLREQGTTVVLNTHILADVGELCSRIGIMCRGRIRWEGPVDEAESASPGGLEGFFMEVVGAS